MNMSRQFQVSARYVDFPTRPIASTLTHISAAKKTKMPWSNASRVERLENATANGDASGRVGARLVHSQRHAVEQDYRHANPLEPAEPASVKAANFTLTFELYGYDRIITLIRHKTPIAYPPWRSKNKSHKCNADTRKQTRSTGQCKPPPRHVLLVSRNGFGSRFRICDSDCICDSDRRQNFTICSLVYC